MFPQPLVSRCQSRSPRSYWKISWIYRTAKATDSIPNEMQMSPDNYCNGDESRFSTWMCESFSPRR